MNVRSTATVRSVDGRMKTRTYVSSSAWTQLADQIMRLSPYFIFGDSVERDGDSEGVRVALSM